MMGLWEERLVSLGVQGTLVLLVVYALVRAFPSLPPLVRVWLLRLGLIKALLSFVWPMSFWSVSLPLESGVGASSLSLIDGLLMLTLGLWICSAITGVWRLSRDRRSLVEWASSAEPAPSDLRSLLANTAAKIGVQKLPSLYVHRRLQSPVLVRCFREMMLLLPPNMLDREAELQAALGHELAHVRHRDLWWAMLSVACSTLLFFHPLVGLCVKELRLAEECAADSLATSALRLPAADYSRLLISLVTSVASPGLGMSGPARDLNRRIQSMYRPRRRRSIVLAIVATCFLAGAAVPWSLDAGAKMHTIVGVSHSAGDSGEFRAAR